MNGRRPEYENPIWMVLAVALAAGIAVALVAVVIVGLL